MRDTVLRIVAIGLLFSAALGAQTTTRSLAWTQPGITTVAAAQALSYRLAVDGAASVVAAQTCTVVGAVVSCAAPLPTLAPGPHTLVLSVDNGFGTASATLSGTSPTSPINLSVVLTVTVTGP